MNFYNEWDRAAAEWIRQLIVDKKIPDGIVDSRSITEIKPDELKDYTQCHFFAGIAGWSRALQLANIPSNTRLWTASLPCQPFSTAGKQAGTGDERHLWPVFERLVRACKPPVIIGEQVASKLARDDWFPGVRLDLEALGYEVGAADLCAPCAGEIGEGRLVRGDQETWERIVIGAPHIRQRLYWVADADSERRSRIDSLLRAEEAGANGARHISEAAGCCEDGGLPDSRSQRLQGHGGFGEEQIQKRRDGGEGHSPSGSMELLPCRDGKTRRTQSGIFPLVNGVPRGVVPSGDPGSAEYVNATGEARVMRLKGYGNSIVPQVAALFIRSYYETKFQG